MKKYRHRLRVVKNFLMNSFFKNKSKKCFKKGISFNKDILKAFFGKAIQDAFSIPYDNFYEDNIMFLDEINEELRKVFLLRNLKDCEFYIRQFERECASYYGAPYAIGVSSGTAALAFSLLALVPVFSTMRS